MILHAPYHSWVPQAWVTCYFTHEWNKNADYTACYQGHCFNWGCVHGDRRLRVCSHFCKECSAHSQLWLAIPPFLIAYMCFWKLSFVSTLVRWKQAGEKGKRTFGASHQQIHKSASPAFLELFVSHPLSSKANNGIFVLCFSLSFQSLYVNIEKPYHSETYAQPGINNTRGTPACFTFTKKIGISKNQDHMGFCVLSL